MMMTRLFSFRAVAAFCLATGLLLTAPAHAQDAADLLLRTTRLENQIRQMSGEIEQLQFENRRLQDQLRRFQEDVEFRFQDGGKGGARPSAPAAQPQTPPQRRGDAFDPAVNPAAPGAPLPLGSPGVASAPLPQGALPGGPASRSPAGGVVIIEDDGAPGQPLDINRLGQTPPVGAPGPATGRSGPSIAATGTASPREQFDAAIAFYRARQYEQSEMGFRQLVQSHPRDRLVPDALYWLGESYAARQRHREAAEQYLKITTEHAASGRAPDAFLRLGVALNALGARDQACATFAEAGRKYPQTSAEYRQRVERERSRARCTA